MTWVSGRRVLHRVGEQIVDRVFHQLAIAFHAPVQPFRDDTNVLALGEGPGARDAGLDDLPDTERLFLQLHLAVRQAFHVQKRLNHARQPLGFLVDHFAHLLALFFA